MDTDIFALNEIIVSLDPTRSIQGINSKISLIKVAKQVVIRALQSNPHNENIRKAANEVYRIEHTFYNHIDYDQKVRGRVPDTVR